MVTSVFILLMVGLIAYYNYTQGFFSATISAALTILCAVFALGWHEWLENLLLRGALEDYASAISLVALFTLSYLLLRYLFDKFVPGNARFPLWLEKVGAPVMGAISGIIALGVTLIALQSLPLPMSIFGYSRYTITNERSVIPAASPQAQDQELYYDGVDAEAFGSDTPNRLWLPADDLVVLLTERVTGETGSLGRGVPFASIHPDLLQEYFGQRAGLEPGVNHVLMAKKAAVRSSDGPDGLFVADLTDQQDAELYGVRRDAKTGLQPIGADVMQNHKLLIVRLYVTGGADQDQLIRLSPGDLRLVVGEGGAGQNYFAVGTVEKVENVRKLMLNEVGDFIFVPAGNGVDVAFLVPDNAFHLVGAKEDQLEIPAAFVEVKRLARVDLSGQTIDASGIRDDSKVGVITKYPNNGFGQPILPSQYTQAPGGVAAPGGTPGGAPAGGTPSGGTPVVAGGPSPLSMPLYNVSTKLPFSIGLPAGTSGDQQIVNLTYGDNATCSLTDNKISAIELGSVDGKEAGGGSNAFNALYAPGGKQIIQVSVQATGWDFLKQVGSFGLKIDQAEYAPVGLWAQMADGKILVYYSPDDFKASRITVPGSAPSQVGLIFLVPGDAGANRELDYQHAAVH